MAWTDVGLVLIGAGLVLGLAAVLFIIIVVYTHFDRKLMHKLKDLDEREREIRDSIKRVNDARANEGRDIAKKLEAIEQRLDVLMEPEGIEKEVAKEKIKARSGK